MGSTPGETPFRPSWWLPGAHLQTLGARFLRSRLHIPLDRERLELPDGDFVDLDHAAGRPHSDGAGESLVIVLHGLEGSARSGYALELHRLLRQRRIASVGVNFRSCSGEPNRLPRFYHSGETGDLRLILDHLSDRYPHRKLGAVGVSLGGNVLLKYLGESDPERRSGIEAAVAISVPFDLSAGADSLLRPSAKLYSIHFLRSLKRKLRAKRSLMPSWVDVARALAARNLREFDDAATAPLHGFNDAEDYYRQCSSARFLHGIRDPTLLIHSEDDPFLPRESIPRATVDANPHLSAAWTTQGGHVGFVTGRSPFAAVFWAERQAVAFLEARLANSSHRDRKGHRRSSASSLGGERPNGPGS